MDNTTSGNGARIVPFDCSPAFLHKRAIKNRRDHNPHDALTLLKRAHELSPGNREYALDLADLYRELGCHEDSNRLLFAALRGQTPPDECFYGLGLNFLEMGDLKLMRDAFSTYLRHHPAGEYAEDAEQMLHTPFLSAGPSFRSARHFAQLAMKACRQLDAGRPKLAARLLLRTQRFARASVDARALLALAYARDGQTKRALRILRGIGRGSSVRALSLCAMAYLELEMREQAVGVFLKAARKDCSFADRRRLAMLACDMGLHAMAYEMLDKLLKSTMYDRALLHAMAVASYKTGRSPARSLACWARVVQMAPPEDTVAGYYLRALENEALPEDLPYRYQVPAEEAVRRMRALLDAFSHGGDALRAQWQQDATLRALSGWAITLPDERIKHMMLLMWASCADEDACARLHALLTERDQPDALKLTALSMLAALGKPGPHLLVLRDSLVYMRGDRGTASTQPVTPLARRMLRWLRRAMGGRALTNRALWNSLCVSSREHPKLKRRAAWRAAIEYAYARLGDKRRVGIAKVAAKHGISRRMAQRYAHRLLRATRARRRPPPSRGRER